MIRRDVRASIAGAVATLVLVGGIALGPSVLGSRARAQQPPEPESMRLLVLAVANAIASVAVDGERTAIALNDATDQLRTMQDRIDRLEKRLAELEKK